VTAFLAAVLLHALWDIFNSLAGRTVAIGLALEILSLTVALTSVVLLVRRLREARRLDALQTVPGSGGIQGSVARSAV
jgi:hypothetical protein